jgi:beta-glucosidase
VIALSLSVLASGQANLSPDARAVALEVQMSDAERVRLLHSNFARPDRLKNTMPEGAIGSASFTPGNTRLGIPALQETDASLGVAWVDGLRKDGATAWPSSLSLASTWDLSLAYQGSAMIAREARAKGFNVLLAGGVNLAREPRNGRNFEYLGEDPLLAGTLAGESIRAIEANHMIATVKHFALNVQETGRHVLSANIAEPAARDSDLLAFKIAIDRGKPGAVMCAYNRYNGPHACQSDFLLNQVLKGDWGYAGFVMSDWGAVRNVSDALAGLDRQSGEELDDKPYFAEGLEQAAATDPAMKARLHDMTRRVLRSMLVSGLFDNPPNVGPIDVVADEAIAHDAAAAGIVLLKNEGLLPLPKSTRSVAIIGGYANVGVMSGGGSSQVQPAAGPALRIPAHGNRFIMFQPSAPLAAVKVKLGQSARVQYDPGFYPAGAAAIARNADIAIVFATQWMTEGLDAPDLSLPQGQDATIAAVTEANPHTIVVLETGGPVLMPWLDRAASVIEAWYPGAKGGEAIADVLFGDVNPSGRLPLTFPASLDQLPRPMLDDTHDEAREAGSQSHALRQFDVNYDIEGSDVGYRWYARTRLKPLFAFGFGLSFTHFSYSDLKVTGGNTVSVSFTVTNDGARAGKDVPQVYVTRRAGIPGPRLVGWGNVELEPGASQRVTVSADLRLLADWSMADHGWKLRGGSYEVRVGASSDALALTGFGSVNPQIIR